MKEIKKTVLDFSNTEIAFSNKNNSELKQTAWLFKMMNNPYLVKYGSDLALKSVNWGLPFSEMVLKNTIFKQFCGGTTLLNSSNAIERLAKLNVKTILDYGVEGKETEEDFNKSMVENIRAIEFASKSKNIPFVSIKVTGLGRFGLLQKIQDNATMTVDEQNEYFAVSKRLDSICHVARDKDIAVLIDAEESWIQDSIDRMANMMMGRYNKDKAVIYNTFQF